MAIEQRREDQLLTVREVAERLRLHPITVRRHIKAGRLSAVRIGRAVRVRESDVNDLARGEERPLAKLPYRWPPAPEGIERRKRIGEGMKRLRESSPPLGMTTAELVREGRRVGEEPYRGGRSGETLPRRSSPTAAELKRRRKAVDALLAFRAKQKPLGTSTEELVREGRKELERRTERHLGLDR